MKLRSFQTRSPTNRRASSVIATAVSRVNCGNLRRSLLAVRMRSKRSHWLTNSFERFAGARVIEHAARGFSTPCGVSSSPRAAAASNSASGMVSQIA